MFEESPSEKQERLERHEELMQKRDERLSSQTRPAPVHGSSSIGSGLGDFVGALQEHKMIIVGGGIALIVVLYIMGKSNSSSSSANNGTANAAGDYASSGIMTSNISSALDAINQQLAGMGAGPPADGPPTPTPTPTPTPAPAPGPFRPGPNPLPLPRPSPGPVNNPLFVRVVRGNTLWGISQSHGISLGRIEQLNPLSSLPSHNWNLIYPGEQIRVK